MKLSETIDTLVNGFNRFEIENFGIASHLSLFGVRSGLGFGKASMQVGASAGKGSVNIHEILIRISLG